MRRASSWSWSAHACMLSAWHEGSQACKEEKKAEQCVCVCVFVCAFVPHPFLVGAPPARLYIYIYISQKRAVRYAQSGAQRETLSPSLQSNRSPPPPPSRRESVLGACAAWHKSRVSGREVKHRAQVGAQVLLVCRGCAARPRRPALRAPALAESRHDLAMRVGRARLLHG